MAYATSSESIIFERILKHITQQYLDYTVHHFIPWEDAKAMVDTVLDKTYQLRNTLKDSTRSMVHLIDFDDQTLIMKEPVEKNKGRWHQLMTLIRKSDALQSCISMATLQEMGIATNKPLVVVEKRSGGMVVDSWYLCTFVDGDSCTEEHYQEVVGVLQKIHQAGYIHGDPHFKNFLTGTEGIQVIDTKLSSVWNFAQKNLELAYLEKSVPAISQYFDTTTFSYKFARFVLYEVQERFKEIKKQIRKVFRS